MLQRNRRDHTGQGDDRSHRQVDAPAYDDQSHTDRPHGDHDRLGSDDAKIAKRKVLFRRLAEDGKNSDDEGKTQKRTRPLPK